MTKADDFQLSTDDDDDDDEWEAEVDWSTEEVPEGADVPDEGAAYLQFLSEEVSNCHG